MSTCTLQNKEKYSKIIVQIKKEKYFLKRQIKKNVKSQKFAKHAKNILDYSA